MRPSVLFSSLFPTPRLGLTAVAALTLLLSGCPDGGPEPEPASPAEPEEEPEDAGVSDDAGTTPEPTDAGDTDAGASLDGGSDAGTDGGLDSGPPPPVDAGPRDAPTLTSVASTLNAGTLTIAMVGGDVDEDLRLIRMIARSDAGALLFDNSFETPLVDREGDTYRAFLRLDLGGLAVAQLSVTAIGSNGNLSETLGTEVNQPRPAGTACITRGEAPPWTACDVDLGCLNATSFIGSCEAAPGAQPVLANVVVESVEAQSAACSSELGKNAVLYRATGTSDLPIAFLRLADGVAPPQFVAATPNAVAPPPPNFNVAFVQCVVSIQEVDEETKDAFVIDTADRASFVRPVVYGDYAPEPGDDWDCSALTFAGADGCHCGCGEPDPDCGGTPDLDTCEICNAPGSCSLGGGCPGSILSTNVAQCIGPFCGDGIVNTQAEQCEPPSGASCDADCQIIVPTPAEACAAATVVAPGANTGTTLGQPDVFAGSCGTSNGSEDQVYVYTTATPDAHVLATVASNIPADHVLYVRTTCSDENTELACVDAANGGAESVAVGPFAVGTDIFLFVDSFRDGSYSLAVEEFVPIVLGTGDVCVFGDLTATCDDAVVGLACLSVAGAFACRIPVVLNTGDACVATDTGEVCDAVGGDICSSDGAGGTICQSPAVAICAAPATLVAGTNTVQTSIDDVSVDAACFEVSHTSVSDYTVTGTGVMVAIGVENALLFDTGLAVRTACLDRASTVDCSPSGETSLFSGPHAAGDVLSVFVGSNSAISYEVDLTVVEGVATTLNLGDACDPASLFATCDAAAGGVCRDEGLGLTCVQAAHLNDTCAAPIPLADIVSPFSGTFLGATNNYNPQDYPDNCTRFRATGLDLVYEVALTAGQTLDVSYTVAGGDASVYVLGTCAPGDAGCSCDDFSMQCVNGVDATLGGIAEVLSFAPVVDGTYFLILDSYDANGATDFELVYTVTP